MEEDFHPRRGTRVRRRVIATKEWIESRGLAPGPLFTRFDHNGLGKDVPILPIQFCRIVQSCLRRIGPPWREYGGHSLRAGFITEAGEAGAGELLIAAQSGHSDMETLRQYFRRRDVFKSTAAALLDSRKASRCFVAARWLRRRKGGRLRIPLAP